MSRFCKMGWAGALVLAWAAVAGAQQCPYQDASGFHPSVVRSLEGRIAYHDGLRKWFELKLDTPECGVRSIQLTRIEGGWAELAGLRGCRVRAEGQLEGASTGYYSLDVFEEVKKLEPLKGCVRQPALPDYSLSADQRRAKPDAALDVYTVEMQVHYAKPDQPIDFLVTHGGQPLSPWPVYANYWLTGGGVLYGQCAEGFYVDLVYGTTEAHPTHSIERMADGDVASFEPETAAATGKKELTLGFTCKRIPK